MSGQISVTEKSQLPWQNLHYSWISTVKQSNLGERAVSVSPHTWGANSSPNTSGRFAAFCAAPIQSGEKLDKQDVFTSPHPPGRGFILHRLFCQITRAPRAGERARCFLGRLNQSQIEARCHEWELRAETTCARWSERDAPDSSGKARSVAGVTMTTVETGREELCARSGGKREADAVWCCR